MLQVPAPHYLRGCLAVGFNDGADDRSCGCASLSRGRPGLTAPWSGVRTSRH